MSTEETMVWSILLFLVAGITSYVFWWYRRSANVLQLWAKQNEYLIVNHDIEPILNGPFDWITTNSQTIYRVRIRTRDGIERAGWVRCGSYWLGVLSHEVEVKWEGEP